MLIISQTEPRCEMRPYSFMYFSCVLLKWPHDLQGFLLLPRAERHLCLTSIYWVKGSVLGVGYKMIKKTAQTSGTSHSKGIPIKSGCPVTCVRTGRGAYFKCRSLGSVLNVRIHNLWSSGTCIWKITSYIFRKHFHLG